MTTFQTETIQPLSAIPTAPHKGDELKQPSEISGSMLEYDVVQSNREMMSHLLSEAGVNVDWQIADDGRVSSNLPGNAQELLDDRIEHYQQRAKEVYDYANEMLPEYKRELIEGLVQYGQRLGVEDDNLQGILGSRIAGVHEVRIMAPLAKGSTVEHIIRNPQVFASMEKKSGELTVDVESLFDYEERTGVSKNIIMKKLVLHELEHAASTLALTENGSWMVHSGLGVFPSREDDEGLRDWTGDFLLEEGAQEHIRWKELDGEPPEYEQGVMLWEMLISLDPQIEKLRFEAKFLNRNRGELIGHIENLLGPMAIEELEAYCAIDGNQRLVNYPVLKDKIVAMIRIGDKDAHIAEDKTKEAQKHARKVLNKTQLEIFKHQGWDYTDEQLLTAKQRGAIAAKDIGLALATS